jgi:hypothetical protein
MQPKERAMKGVGGKMSRRQLSTLAVIAFSQVACSGSAPVSIRDEGVRPTERSTHDGPPILPHMLSREYQAAHHVNKSSTLVDPETLPGSFGFTEIAIERTPCFGHCPVFVASIREDGRMSYWGESDALRDGRHFGTVHAFGFAYLAGLANDLGIDELDDEYSIAITDQDSVYLALTRHGRRKLIAHYAPLRCGPPRLTAFENEIDHVLEQAKWD